MGMAASQARYLGLTARKTNVEWEGQQINQARTALSNQSANLFNQMLTVSVPNSPDKTNYTTLQYTYDDGSNSETISDWKQLSNSDSEYNYTVDHYYTSDLYTGSQKLVSDPQVTIKGATSATATNYSALTANADGTYSYAGKDAQGNAATYNYSDLTNYTNDKEMQNAVQDLIDQGKISVGDTTNINLNSLTDSDGSKYSLMGYNDGTSWHLAKSTDLAGKTSDGYLDLSKYSITGSAGNWTISNPTDAATLAKQLGTDKTATDATTWLNTYYNGTDKYYKTDGTASASHAANTAYNDYSTAFTPTKIGNKSLTELGSLDSDDEAALEQIINDLPSSSVAKYFTKDANGDYKYNGTGLYKYTDNTSASSTPTGTTNSTTKYTTYDDLVNSMQTSLFNNKPIDDQQALATYQASYVSTKVASTDKAMLETDSNGRFTSVKFANDSTKYSLNCSETTNETAYDDAMNQYNYNVSTYEKQIADINAKTEVIQQQDRTLELRLKQLDTEQSALQTEMEAVKKVISKNIESTFKTFGGS